MSLAEIISPTEELPPCSPGKAMEICKRLKLSPGLGAEGVQAGMEALKKLGPTAAPALAELLQSGPTHARMLAAVLLGGPCATPGVAAPLCRALADKEKKVYLAAAYALGDLDHPGGAPHLLLEVVSDHDPALRTAAASSLLALGCTKGIPLLLAVLAAGIPGAEKTEKEFRLPRKDRWALEKEIALAALRRLSKRNYGMEPEMGWQDQREAAKKWHDWWTREGRKSGPTAGKELTTLIAAKTATIIKSLHRLPPKDRKSAHKWLALISR